jgi:hypothetical protein
MTAQSAMGRTVDQQADLCRCVKQFLTAQHFKGFGNLDVSAVEDCITLSGSAPSFHMRQLAIACCLRVAGVRQVTDQIVVPPPVLKPAPSGPRLVRRAGLLTS